VLHVSSAGISVVPNASNVRGTLERVTPESDGYGAVWEIAVDETCDVDGLPNFAQPYVGAMIQAWVHPQLHTNIREKDKVQARVAYRGDARGGRFVLINDDIHRM